MLELSKTIMYEFWYNSIKLNYQIKRNLCYVDADNFIINMKTKDVYKDIENNVKKRSDTSNYEDKRSIRICKNKR